MGFSANLNKISFLETELADTKKNLSTINKLTEEKKADLEVQIKRKQEEIFKADSNILQKELFAQNISKKLIEKNQEIQTLKNLNNLHAQALADKDNLHAQALADKDAMHAEALQKLQEEKEALYIKNRLKAFYKKYKNKIIGSGVTLGSLATAAGVAKLYNHYKRLRK